MEAGLVQASELESQKMGRPFLPNPPTFSAAPYWRPPVAVDHIVDGVYLSDIYGVATKEGRSKIKELQVELLWAGKPNANLPHISDSSSADRNGAAHRPGEEELRSAVPPHPHYRRARGGLAGQWPSAEGDGVHGEGRGQESTCASALVSGGGGSQVYHHTVHALQQERCVEECHHGGRLRDEA